MSMQRKLRRPFTLAVTITALAALPRTLAAEDCLETCRQTFGGLRYAKGTLMLLHDCWVTNGTIYCEYQQWL